MSNGDAYAGIGYGQSIRSGMSGRYPAKSGSGKRENDKLKNHSYMLLMITLIFFLVQSQVHACEPVCFFCLKSHFLWPKIKLTHPGNFYTIKMARLARERFIA